MKERVTKEQYGSYWPFTVEAGFVYSDGDQAIFETKEKKYIMNGVASMHNRIDLIWADNQSIPGTKINIGSFIALALKNNLCDGCPLEDDSDCGRYFCEKDK